MGINPPVYFLHIPKTGGTSFSNICPIFAGGIFNMQVVERGISEVYPFYGEINSPFIRVHAPFGFYTEIIKKPFYYTTLIRNPITRFSSFFRDVNNPVRQGLHPLASNDIKNYCDLDWIRNLPPWRSAQLYMHLDNCQVRLLSSSGKVFSTTLEKRLNSRESPLSKREIRKLKIDEKDYNSAIANIEKFFSFTFLTEELELGWELVAKRFSWKFMGVGNPGGSNPKRPPPLLESKLILQWNKWDNKLYKYILSNKERLNTRPLIPIGRTLKNFLPSLERVLWPLGY